MKFAPLVAMLLALTPLSLRAFNGWMDADGKNQSYLPSFESRRGRKAFRTRPVEQLRQRHPEWVFIGDSMLGTRIESQLLAEISGTGDRDVAVLLQAASGPAYWYLAFKNQLAGSGVSPRMTFFFFRDTNITDTMFRLSNTLGDATNWRTSRSPNWIPSWPDVSVAGGHAWMLSSTACVRYISDFRHWAESQGACCYDETGDPELTLDLYEDGDHFRDRVAYTKIFRRRLDLLFRSE